MWFLVFCWGALVRNGIAGYLSLASEVCKSEAERFAFMQNVMVSELQGEGSAFVILGLHVILWMSIVHLGFVL